MENQRYEPLPSFIRPAADHVLSEVAKAHPAPYRAERFIIPLPSGLTQAEISEAVSFLVVRKIIEGSNIPGKGIEFRFNSDHGQVPYTINDYEKWKVKDDAKREKKQKEEDAERIKDELDTEVKKSTIENHKRSYKLALTAFFCSLLLNIWQFVSPYLQKQEDDQENKYDIADPQTTKSDGSIPKGSNPIVPFKEPLNGVFDFGNDTKDNVVNDTFHSPKDTNK